jgi:hypothetical protein
VLLTKISAIPGRNEIARTATFGASRDRQQAGQACWKQTGSTEKKRQQGVNSILQQSTRAEKNNKL